MPGTRSSARVAANGSSPSSPQDKGSSPNANTGSKRKANAGDSPQSKRGRKQQKTLDETMPGNDEETSERGEENATSANGGDKDEQDQGVESEYFGKQFTL